jgi:aspartate aminotransferase
LGLITIKYSHRIAGIQLSPTLAIAAKLKEYKAKGFDVIDFSIGEPNFDLFANIKQAGIRAIEENKSRYTPVAGIPELRAAIQKKLLADNRLSYDASEIVVSSGAKQSLFNVISALANPGDEFIIVKPYWVSYADIVKLAGATPVFAESDEQFHARAALIEKKITPKTKALIINYPCNPTGNTIQKEELAAIAALAIKHDFYIVSDEIYEHLTFEGTHISIASLSPAIKQRTIVVNGFSKAYAMTGLRVGYAAGPKQIMQLTENLQSQVTSGASSVAQYMALAALNTPREELQEAYKLLQKKRDLAVHLLKEAGFSVSKPAGAFYVFISIQDFHMSSQEFAERLMEEQHVAVVPGSAFGTEGYIRISYATAEDTIRRGVERIKAFCSQVQ